MSNVRRRTWYTRRRTRSVGSMPCAWQSHNVLLQLNQQTQSDEMCSSSTSKDKDCPTYQSDSDDIYSDQYEPCFSTFSGIPNTMESDSFNENSPCHRSTRRKRKFKRIAMEIEISGNSRFYTHSHAAQSYSKKKRAMRHALHHPSNRLWLSTGKRKRSVREKPINSMDGESSDPSRDPKVLAISKLSLDDYPREQANTMEVTYTVAGVSSSSISSSGSETEIYTNDEGREGDDEQSDWIGDVGLAAGGSFNQDDHTELDKGEQLYSYHKYLRGNFENTEDKRTFKFFSSDKKDAEVRLSRRKGRSMKPNFNFMLPTDKTSKFIPSFLENTQSKNRMDVECSTVTRRHTFSGYKKRKRIPTNSVLSDNVSDKSSEVFIPTVHKLSDISSSDSKESLK